MQVFSAQVSVGEYYLFTPRDEDYTPGVGRKYFWLIFNLN